MSEESENKSYSCCGPKSTASKSENQEKFDLESAGDVRQKIRSQYGAIASNKKDVANHEVKESNDSEDCGCGYTNYSDTDLESIPEGSELGLGTGNPVALAEIKEGETIVDLGSAAGVASFIAAKQTVRYRSHQVPR